MGAIHVISVWKQLCLTFFHYFCCQKIFVLVHIHTYLRLFLGPIRHMLPLGVCYLCVYILLACSSSKFIPDEHYLLDRVDIKSDVRDFDASQLLPYVRQKTNSKWFSLFKIPLGTYALSGRDTTKWVNRTLQRIGEAPILYDTAQARQTCVDLVLAMRDMGYMNASALIRTERKGKKRIRVTYVLHPGTSYRIGQVHYQIDDEQIAHILQGHEALHPGMKFTVATLAQERKRLTELLADSGYYRFHQDFIQYDADTIAGSKDIALTLHLLKYKVDSEAEAVDHPRYYIRKVYIESSDSDHIHLRKGVIDDNMAVEPGAPYSAHYLQQTYNNFSRLQAVRYTNIRFREVPDTTLLDCYVQVSMNKPSTLAFQPEGTNTAGDLGAAASLTYTNRNLFHGSEQLSIALRGAYEAITGLEGYKDQNYKEYSIEGKIAFPRFVAPFLSRSFRRRQTATSELSVSWDLQNRPEFHRRVFSSAWRYRWAEPHHHLNWRFDLIDLNYVYMPWISETFKRDYLDSETTRNAILRYNYEDLFIMKVGFGVSYNNGTDAFRANIESAGNLLEGLSRAFRFKQNGSGQHTLFNIAYAQYAKFDLDYTHLHHFDSHNALALHACMGVAYPYGNSTVLPFEKRYFSGGANSVRGWSVRELGPGKFRGTDGRIDFINQTGDIKLDLNAEYRSFLFWKIYGAAFVDAGNIWTLRAYNEQPGGQFHFKTFLRQLAVAYGLGLRLNLDYFVLRMDMGMKAITPGYITQQEHYAVFHPNMKRDFVFHFAVGMPF